MESVVISSDKELFSYLKEESSNILNNCLSIEFISIIGEETYLLKKLWASTFLLSVSVTISSFFVYLVFFVLYEYTRNKLLTKYFYLFCNEYNFKIYNKKIDLLLKNIYHLSIDTRSNINEIGR